jgi:hypothetical protein
MFVVCTEPPSASVQSGWRTNLTGDHFRKAAVIVSSSPDLLLTCSDCQNQRTSKRVITRTMSVVTAKPSRTFAANWRSSSASLMERLSTDATRDQRSKARNRMSKLDENNCRDIKFIYSAESRQIRRRCRSPTRPRPPAAPPHPCAMRVVTGKKPPFFPTSSQATPRRSCATRRMACADSRRPTGACLRATEN